MRRNNDKDKVAVLLHIQSEIYDRYLKTLEARHLKRQAHSAELFTKAIEKEIEKYSKE